MRCRVKEALEENPTNALASKAVCELLQKKQMSWRRVVALGVVSGVSMPVITSALSRLTVVIARSFLRTWFRHSATFTHRRCLSVWIRLVESPIIADGRKTIIRNCCLCVCCDDW